MVPCRLYSYGVARTPRFTLISKLEDGLSIGAKAALSVTNSFGLVVVVWSIVSGVDAIIASLFLGDLT